jgi:hypothetical protein
MNIEAVIWTIVFLLSMIPGLCVKSNHVISNLILSGNNNDKGLGFGALLLIVGLSLFYNSLKNLKQKRLFENLPTSKMRSVAMGLVELKGRIEAAESMIKDPFDDKDCVYWSVTIEEYVKRGKSHKWVTRHEANDSVPFLFSDDTGFALVDSRKADIKNVRRDSQYESAPFFSEELPVKIKQYCVQHGVKYTGWLGGKRKMRCRTTYLEPNDKLYIIGSARPITEKESIYSNSAKATIDYKKGGHFLISEKSEKELIHAYGGQSWLVPLGIILSALGLGIILNAFGSF